MFTRRTHLTSRRRQVAHSSKSTLYRQLFRGGLLITLLSLSGWGIWEVTRLPALSITSIEISGGETISHEHVRSLVDDALRGRYALLVPYRFSFFYPRDALMAAVLSEPRIKSVSIDKKAPTALHVTFSEYEPKALWCGDLSEVSPCYFIDDDGYAFAPAPTLQGGAFIRYVLEQEAVPSERQMIDGERYNRARTIVSLIESHLAFRVTDIVFTKDDDEQYWLFGGSSIRVTRDKSPDTVIADLKTILNSDEFKHLAPGNFAYIDLRFENKVFINEDLATSSASSTATTTEAVVTTASTTLPD